LGFALSVMAATAAHARGPALQPWMVYPAKAMATCRAGTAPPKIAIRCDELLEVYARELEACGPMRRGGPLIGLHQVAMERENPNCAAAAAVNAAKAVK
jgi:hypothetical protein